MPSADSGCRMCVIPLLGHRLSFCVFLTSVLPLPCPQASHNQNAISHPLSFLKSTLLGTLPAPNLILLQRHLRRLNPTHHHRAERRAHAVGAVELAELHPAHDESGDDLARPLDDRVFRAVHVQSAHPAEGPDGVHGDEALRAEGAEGAVVAGRGDYKGGVDRAVIAVSMGEYVGFDGGRKGEENGSMYFGSMHE